MEGDLSCETHPSTFGTVAAASVGVLDIDEHRVDGLDGRGGCREQRHDSRVTKYLEELAALVAIAPRSDCGREILGAPRHAVHARMQSQILDVEQALRGFSCEQQEL